MLSQFSFKNYKSYKDEAILDLEAVSAQGFQESLLSDGYKYSYLPVSVIYGPNGGGKSNVLEAVSALIKTVVLPILAIRGTANQSVIPLTPFMFDSTSKEKPIEFEMFFQPDDMYEYKYILHLNQGSVVKEQLYRRKLANNGRITTLFERYIYGVKLGSSINKKTINKDVNERMPYLSFLAANYKIESINVAAAWFEKCVLLLRLNGFSYGNIQLRLGNPPKKEIREVLLKWAPELIDIDLNKPNIW